MTTDYDYDYEYEEREAREHREHREHRDPECRDGVCKRTVIQKADVSVPVEIKPNATIGRIKSECIGEPHITSERCNQEGGCRFVITQTICVRIPIQYNVQTEVGENEITCHTASGH